MPQHGLVGNNMSVLDIYVKRWNQRSAIIKATIIACIILVVFLTPMVVFFDPNDVWLEWIGLTFINSVYLVPFILWDAKIRSHTLSIDDYIMLANEPESTEWNERWSRKRNILVLVSVIALIILFLLVPLYSLLLLEEYPGDRSTPLIIETVLTWAAATLAGFGIAYQPEMERTMHFGNDVCNATFIAKLLEERNDVERIQVNIMIRVTPVSITIFFSGIQFSLPGISDETAEVSLESNPGEGTGVYLNLKGRFDIQQMDDAQEYDIGLDYNIGFWIDVQEKEITVNVWYPKEEGMKNVRDLGIDEYRKMLDFLFQNIEKFENLNGEE